MGIMLTRGDRGPVHGWAVALVAGRESICTQMRVRGRCSTRTFNPPLIASVFLMKCNQCPQLNTGVVEKVWEVTGLESGRANGLRKCDQRAALKAHLQ